MATTNLKTAQQGQGSGSTRPRLRVKDIQRIFQVCRNTVRNWEREGVLPEARRLKDRDGKTYGRMKWWNPEDLEHLVNVDVRGAQPALKPRVVPCDTRIAGGEGA
ncbi:MAG: hypothetical protein V4684_10405 [Pseudomonadota bacterium]|jgi:hypothetical protein